VECKPAESVTSTTDTQHRELAALKEIVETRLDGMDRALELFNEQASRVPSEVDKQVTHLRELVFERIEGGTKVEAERFQGVYNRFAERDVRVEQTARDTKVAVDAALAAQKEMGNKQTESFAQSIAKSEAATSKQIDQLGQLLTTTNLSTDGKIADIKERLTRLEGEDKGARQAVVTQQTSNMNTVSVIGLVLGTLIGVGGLVAAFVAANGS